MKFENIQPDYSVKRELYGPASEEMLPQEQADKFEISQKKQIGCGGQA